MHHQALGGTAFQHAVNCVKAESLFLKKARECEYKYLKADHGHLTATVCSNTRLKKQG